MRRFEVIEQAIATKWGDDPAVRVCHAIIEHVVSKASTPKLMLTYSDLLKITGLSFDEDSLQQAVTILTTRFKALKLRLLYIDPCGELFYLDEEEQSEFLESGVLSHPSSGEIVEAPEEHTYPYYIACPPALVEEVGH